MNVPFIARLVVVAPAVLAVACAAPRDLLREKPSAVFVSALRPQALTTCIDRNTDGAAANSLRTNIKTPEPEATEIVVRNGSFVYAVIQIVAEGTGGRATFYLGGAATLTPEGAVALMTKGCS